MGNSKSSLNVFICGVNQIEYFTPLTNKLFPEKRNNTERKIKKEDIYFVAKLFNGRAENNLNQIKNIIRTNMQNNEKNNVILIYPDKDRNLTQNTREWMRIANKINELPELNIPFIIFLSFDSYEEIKNRIFRDNNDIFGEFKDKRKIMILKIFRDFNSQENLESSYRKILSLLWDLNQIYHQKPFTLSKIIDANLFRINREEPQTTAIKILMAGFSRKGKSTFLNMSCDKFISYESPSLIPVTSETIEITYMNGQNNRNQNEDDNIKGAIKFIDIPGIIEGTNENLNVLINLIKESIKNQELTLDVINYVIFILKSQPNFQGTDSFFKLLNDSGIKVIFIINDSTQGATKETMIDYFINIKRLPNLIINNGENILQVDVRSNEIRNVYKYIYQDLINENRFDMNIINQLNDNNIFTYLHENSKLYSKIHSKEDFIQRARKKANEGIKNNVIQHIKGYKKSFELIKNLSEKEDWSSKIRFPEEEIN